MPAFIYVLPVIVILAVSPLITYGRMDDSQKTRDTVLANLTIYQNLIDSLTGEMSQKIGPSVATPVVLSLKGSGDKWFVGQGISSALRRMGYQVFTDDSAAGVQNVQILEVLPVLSISYDDPSREGIFGQKKVRRSVTVEFTYQVHANKNGEVLADGKLHKSAVDSIFEDAIPSIENTAIPATHAEIHEDTLLDRIIEPLVIIGVAGTAVYLFFHVRS